MKIVEWEQFSEMFTNSCIQIVNVILICSKANLMKKYNGFQKNILKGKMMMIFEYQLF